jgi:hypothetical protein
LFYFPIALGWYQSFYWGTAILQGSTRPKWRLPRDAFTLMVGPVLPLVAVAKRFRVVRGPVARGLLVLAAICSFAWIGMWVTLFHDTVFEGIVLTHLTGPHEGFFSSFGSEFWNAIFAPWFRPSSKMVLTISIIQFIPLLSALAEAYVRLYPHDGEREAADRAPVPALPGPPFATKRPRLFLVTTRPENDKTE